MSTTNRRPGGRSARVVRAVLRATIEELATEGWSGLQIDAVAARAGVHKTTVYRRWPTRGALVADAVTSMPFRSLGAGLPDTGTFRADLAALIDDLVAAWSIPRTRLVARALMAARDDPDVSKAVGRYLSTQMERIAAVVTRAQSRGEVPAAVDPEFIAELYVGTVFVHMVEFDRLPSPAWAAQLLDVICIAAQVIEAGRGARGQPG